MICLIKPQFEAGKEKVEKGGVVKDKKVHLEVIQNVLDCALNLGYTVKGLTFSSIKGPSGNIEYLVWLEFGKEETYSEPDIEFVIDDAFSTLN